MGGCRVWICWLLGFGEIEWWATDGKQRWRRICLGIWGLVLAFPPILLRSVLSPLFFSISCLFDHFGDLGGGGVIGGLTRVTKKSNLFILYHPPSKTNGEKCLVLFVSPPLKAHAVF
jgi:hypothetical protein